jgi:hypothetical protein
MDEIPESDRKDRLECDPAWLEAGRQAALKRLNQTPLWFWRDEIEDAD